VIPRHGDLAQSTRHWLKYSQGEGTGENGGKTVHHRPPGQMDLKKSQKNRYTPWESGWLPSRADPDLEKKNGGNTNWGATNPGERPPSGRTGFCQTKRLTFSTGFKEYPRPNRNLVQQFEGWTYRPFNYKDEGKN